MCLLYILFLTLVSTATSQMSCNDIRKLYKVSCPCTGDSTQSCIDISEQYTDSCSCTILSVQGGINGLNYTNERCTAINDVKTNASIDGKRCMSPEGIGLTVIQEISDRTWEIRLLENS